MWCESSQCMTSALLNLITCVTCQNGFLKHRQHLISVLPRNHKKTPPHPHANMRNTTSCSIRRAFATLNGWTQPFFLCNLRSSQIRCFLSSEHALYIPVGVSLYPGQHQTPARCAPLLCSLPWVSPSQAELSATSFFIYKMSTSILLWHFYIACWFCVCWSLSPYFELLEKGPSLTHLLHLQHSAWYKTTGIH